MYPPGHPSQERSASGVSQRVTALLEQRPAISIGFARHQVIIEGVASDPRHPLLRTFAEKFHKQHIGALTFQRDVSAAEIAGMMTLIATESEKSDKPVGLGPAEQLRQWPHIRLHPVTYDQLQLVGDTPDEAEEEREQTGQLWIGLAQAAMQSGDPAGAEQDPAAIAAAINRHGEARGYDQVIVGYLLQITRELKQDDSAASKPVRERMAQLIGALDGNALRRIVAMGGDVHQRAQFLADATQSLPPDAVIEIARAAGETAGQTISTSLIRMLTKLSAFVEQGPPQMQERADTELREQVQQLVRDWSLEDPNPEEYTSALQQMAQQQNPTVPQRGTHAPEPLRIVQMAIEVGAVGVPFWRAIDEMVRSNQLGPLLDTLRNAADSPVVTAVWKRLATEEKLHAMLELEDVDFDLVRSMVEQMEPNITVHVLLDVLANSESRNTRLGVIRLLVDIGAIATSSVVERLNDERWYVKRNALLILNELHHVPSDVNLSEYARHPDPRVRREAVALWLSMPQERERAIFNALTDSDSGVLRTGLTAASEHGVSEALAPAVATRLNDQSVSPDVRLQLVRILGRIGNALALDTLFKTVVIGKTLFGAPKLAEPSPVVIAALTTLAERWPEHPRIKPVIKKALKSRYPNVRAAVQRTAPQA